MLTTALIQAPMHKQTQVYFPFQFKIWENKKAFKI